MLQNYQQERYSRQVLLSEFGEAGQQKLSEAKVLVIGAGGLGCPVLQYLAAAGLGTLGIIDDDVVAESNLHRQVLFGFADVGQSKALVAAQKLKQLNPGVKLAVYNQRLTTGNAWELISEFDIVVDGSDNFATRYLVNDACVLLSKPLVYGSIFRFEGQVAVFNYEGSANYRHLYPNQPADGEVPGCAEAGVLGVLTGIIGSLMANEVIKIVAGIGTVLSGQVLTYNSLSNLFYPIKIVTSKHLAFSAPASRAQFEQMDYGDYCKTVGNVTEIDVETFEELRAANNIEIIDVREEGETPTIDEFETVSMPLSQLKHTHQNIKGATVVFVCQSGVRSRQAANMLVSNSASVKKIFTLKGGILQWKREQVKRVQ